MGKNHASQYANFGSLHLYIIYETLQVTRLFLTLDSLRRSKHIKNNVKFKM